MTNLTDENQNEMNYFQKQVNSFCDKTGLLYKIDTSQNTNEALRPVVKLYTNSKGKQGILICEAQYTYCITYKCPRWSIGALANNFDISLVEDELNLN